MKRYDIITDHFEINLNDKRSPAYHAHIRHGLTADEILTLCTQADNGQHVIESYTDLDAARTALAKRWAPRANTRFLHSFSGTPLLVGDYYAIEENDYDEDGEWVGVGDLWDSAVEPYELSTDADEDEGDDEG